MRLAAGRDWWFSYKKSVARPERFELPTTWFEVVPDTLLRNPTKTSIAGFSKT
jgi:hypothetical protein